MTIRGEVSRARRAPGPVELGTDHLPSKSVKERTGGRSVAFTVPPLSVDTGETKGEITDDHWGGSET